MCHMGMCQITSLKFTSEHLTGVSDWFDKQKPETPLYYNRHFNNALDMFNNTASFFKTNFDSY